jgi:putative transposase
LDPEALTEIRGSLNKGLALGGERFKDDVEAVLARSVRPKQAGRRRNQMTDGL